jgi:hypothetical protein
MARAESVVPEARELFIAERMTANKTAKSCLSSAHLDHRRIRAPQHSGRHCRIGGHFDDAVAGSCR